MIAVHRVVVIVEVVAVVEATEHTPGPWSACGDGDCVCKTVTCGDHPVALVTHGKWGDNYAALRLVGTTSLDMKAEAYMEQITYGEVPEATAKANALLIAAAPELLAALTGFCEASRDDLNDTSSEVWQQASRAIGKATGRKEQV